MASRARGLSRCAQRPGLCSQQPGVAAPQSPQSARVDHSSVLMRDPALPFESKRYGCEMTSIIR